MLIFKFNSFNWSSSKTEGASIITSLPALFLGNAMQSLIESNPANNDTKRSNPYAKPP